MQGESKRGSAQDANAKRKPKVSTPARLLLTSARRHPHSIQQKEKQNQTFTYQRMYTRHGVQPTARGSRHCRRTRRRRLRLLAIVVGWPLCWFRAHCAVYL